MANAANLLKNMAKKQQTETKKKEEHPVIPLKPTVENVKAVLEWIRAKRQEKQGETLRSQQEEILLPIMKPLRVNWCREHSEYQSNVKFSIDIREYKKQLIEAAKTPEDKAEIAALSDDHILSFVTQYKYSEISLDKEQPLRNIVAVAYGTKSDEELDSQFQKLFSTETAIEISDQGKLEIDSLLPKIMEAVAFNDSERDEYRKLTGLEKLTEGQSKRLEELQAQLGEKFAKYFSVSQFYKPTKAFHEGALTDSKMGQVMQKAEGDGLIKPQKPSLRNQ